MIKQRFLIKALIVLILVLFTHPGKLQAQNKYLITWGVENALPKYIVSNFNNDYIFIDGFGSVPVSKKAATNFNLDEDFNFFVALSKNNWNIKFTGGLYTEVIKINGERLEINHDLNAGYNYIDYFNNRAAGVRFGTSVGYRISKKRASQIYVSGGVNADVVKYSTELNPVNKSSEFVYHLLTSSASTYVPLYQNYYDTPVSLTSSIDWHKGSSIFSVVGEYKNDALDFGSTKPHLYQSNFVFKLQWSIIIGYKYK